MNEINKNQGDYGVLRHSQFVLNFTGFRTRGNVQESRFYRLATDSMYFSCGIFISFRLYMMSGNNNDVSIIIQNILDATALVTVLIRSFWLVSHKNSIIVYIKESGRLLSITKLNPESSMIMEPWLSREAKMAKWYTGSFVVVAIVYCFFPILYWGKRLPIGATLLPYAHKLPWFCLFYSVDVIVITFELFGSVAMNIFLTFFITHLSGELECVAHRISKFGRDTTTSLMKNIVDDHVVTIAHANKICRLFSSFLYIEIINCTFCACLSGFTVLLSINATVTGKALVLLFLSIFKILLICFLGEILSQMSLRVHEAVMNSNWYLCNKKDRNVIQLILLQSQKPLQFRLGTRGVLNLEGFTVIMFHLYSLMTVLNTSVEHWKM